MSVGFFNDQCFILVPTPKPTGSSQRVNLPQGKQLFAICGKVLRVAHKNNKNSLAYVKQTR